MSIEEKLQALGLEFRIHRKPVGNYRPARKRRQPGVHLRPDSPHQWRASLCR